MSDHEYEVEHNKRNRPEIHRGGGGKKKIKKIMTTDLEPTIDLKHYTTIFCIHNQSVNNLLSVEI